MRSGGGVVTFDEWLIEAGSLGVVFLVILALLTLFGWVADHTSPERIERISDWLFGSKERAER